MKKHEDHPVRCSVVIPTLNEEQAIAEVLDEIPDSLWRQGEVIVVDASRDRTAEIARQRGARVVEATRRGKGFQTRLGVGRSRGDIIILMDGDGEHPPDHIPSLIEKLEEGYDIVLGTRNRVKLLKHPTMGILFYLYLPGLLLMFKLVGLGLRGTPLTGFRCMWRDTWDRMRLKSNNFLFEAEMNIQIADLDLSWSEVHIPFRERYKGMQDSRVLKSNSIRVIVKYTFSHILKKWAGVFMIDR